MAKLFGNSGDPDQTLHSAASDLALHCLPVTLSRVSRLQRVKVYLRYRLLHTGGGKKTESNIAALRRNNRVEQSKSLKKEDLVIVEHADWSNDRIRNAFCILQCSCSQNGMLLKWTTEGSNSRYV